MKGLKRSAISSNLAVAQYLSNDFMIQRLVCMPKILTYLIPNSRIRGKCCDQDCIAMPVIQSFERIAVPAALTSPPLSLPSPPLVLGVLQSFRQIYKRAFHLTQIHSSCLPLAWFTGKSHWVPATELITPDTFY